MNEKSPPNSPRLPRRSILPFLGGIWTVLLIGALIASFFPVIGERRIEEEGEYCNHNLDLIFEAKTRLARDRNVFSERSPEEILKEVTPQDLEPYLKEIAPGRDFNCPSGGTYRIRPLVDRFGEVVAPVCDFEGRDSDGDGLSNAAEGLHIHRPSHLRDVETGLYFREPVFSFAE